MTTAMTPETRFPGDAVALAAHERSRPLGDLVHGELLAYAEFGYRMTSDALIPPPGRGHPGQAGR